MRPKNTVLRPCRWNQASVRSMSETLIRGTRAAMALVRSWPIRAPIQYSTTAPTTDPTVVQTIAASRLMSPGWP